ncbi:MAG TPA: MBOAT family O-acyltransferase [Candidatus Deferrimicrobiaceae bacterium]|jgi:D-alanyl-lipoteichoic acid acyltransferase DltB (MBOAT superfamily)
MSPTGTVYLAFLLIAVAAYRLTGGVRRFHLATILLLSFLFYASWNPVYCVPLAVTAMLDFNTARYVSRRRGRRAARVALAADIAANLCILAAFKYFNFMADNAVALASAIGYSLPPVPIRVVFGVGISFYTFQSMSYVIDVHRGDAEPARSFADYLAFVAFFPTLLAGPITRASVLLPQLERPAPPITAEQGGRALFLIALGFIKKIVVADYLAVNLVNRVFELPGMYSSAELLAGIYGYAAQIYCDFSGYSDIAIGSALLLGIGLKDNFNAPYRSRDLPEFWRRWHISLSTWLRDYLFFSLPKNRSSKWAPYFNTLVTFALGGLWHGASWTFLAWGALHGTGLAVARFFDVRRPRGRNAKPVPRWRQFAGVFVTFHFVCLTWVFFRCDSVDQAFGVLQGLGRLSGNAANITWPIAGLTLAGIVLQWLPETVFPRLQARFIALPSPVQCALLAGTAVAVARVSGSSVSQFIYFNF